MMGFISQRTNNIMEGDNSSIFILYNINKYNFISKQLNNEKVNHQRVQGDLSIFQKPSQILIFFLSLEFD